MTRTSPTPAEHRRSRPLIRTSPGDPFQVEHGHPLRHDSAGGSRHRIHSGQHDDSWPRDGSGFRTIPRSNRQRRVASVLLFVVIAASDHHDSVMPAAALTRQSPRQRCAVRVSSMPSGTHAGRVSGGGLTHAACGTYPTHARKDFGHALTSYHGLPNGQLFAGRDTSSCRIAFRVTAEDESNAKIDAHRRTGLAHRTIAALIDRIRVYRDEAASSISSSQAVLGCVRAAPRVPACGVFSEESAKDRARRHSLTRG